jgi:catalase
MSEYPESTHMMSWLLDDVGIPASYREIDGWGIHTYKWIATNGDATFVRYYYKSDQGVVSLDDDEAVKMPFSFATTDLFDNIEAGNFPSW